MGTRWLEKLISVTLISRSCMPLIDTCLAHAQSTGLAVGQERSGSGQHLITFYPVLPHKWRLSIVGDIKDELALF